MSSNTMCKHKLVILGEQGVGKTSVITRFMYDNYDSNYQATIGIDFLLKTLWFGEKPVRLQLWDTAGQERFRSLIPSYIRDSSAAIVVFDVTNRHTFENIEQWIRDVRAERGADALIALVGNKVDCEPETPRAVTAKEAEDKAKQLGVKFYETSAKTGYNVRNLFNEIAMALPGLEAAGPGHNSSLDIQLTASPVDADRAAGESSLCKC